MPISVAIVGSGPAGFYTAEALVKTLDGDVAVDILERLPTPFGLIRAGVAPDHQTTKKVARSFEKTAHRPEVRYFGNVEVGRDVALAELQRTHDAVVLAVGAPFDRPLGIPGEDKVGVIGSAAFVGWYNAHPDFADLDPDLNTETVCVIGNGNVAIDVARVLVKTAAEMADSDIPEYAQRAIARAPIKDVYLFGRRGPIEAKFTNVELREMGRLDECAPVVDAAQLPDAVGEMSERDHRLKEKNLATLREFATQDAGERRKRVHFRFFVSPVEILGGQRVEGLRLEKTRLEGGRAVGVGETFEVACGLVIPAVGYRSVAVEGAPFDEANAIVRSEEGRVAPGLYAVGWIRRGPTGVIATNRPDGVAVAQCIRDDFGAGAKPGRVALERLLEERGVQVVGYADWKRIEQAEEAGAAAPAPRRKLFRIADMLNVARTGEARRSAD
ncbi:MAG TPA: FAD-dependent oxidoreductase [Rhodospirillales bacterium]|jgi:ferredoxin--NADP+ reductase|nr:FAD-dependent oxidoreductase [Rhodospirillales bacterium]HJO69506.1 FAD-dependent oxidoreductase [Rhodospirillales bacterium]